MPAINESSPLSKRQQQINQINLAHLQQLDLIHLELILKNHPDKFLAHEKIYSIPNHYLHHGRPTNALFQLSHSLLRRQSSDHIGEQRWEILGSKLAEGGSAVVSKSLGTLKFTASPQSTLVCETHHARVVKILKDPLRPNYTSAVQHELAMGQRMEYMHMKTPVSYQHNRKVFTAIVMHLLPGEELFARADQVLHQKQLPSIDTCLAIMLSLCQALARVHAQGIVHCDVKLENFYTDTVPAAVHSYLFDFDLSKLQNAASNAIVCGSLFYCAPEVLLQRGSRLATDIFSLGVTLWAFLGGNFIDGDTDEENVDNLLNLYCQNKTYPLIKNPRAPTRFENDFRHDGNEIHSFMRLLIEQMLTHDPDQRFSLQRCISALQFRMTLRQMRLLPLKHALELENVLHCTQTVRNNIQNLSEPLRSIDLRKIILDGLENIADTVPSVEYFVRLLDVAFLINLRTKPAVQNKIERVFEIYDDAQLHYGQQIQRYEQLKNLNIINDTTIKTELVAVFNAIACLQNIRIKDLQCVDYVGHKLSKLLTQSANLLAKISPSLDVCDVSSGRSHWLKRVNPWRLFASAEARVTSKTPASTISLHLNR